MTMLTSAFGRHLRSIVLNSQKCIHGVKTGGRSAPSCTSTWHAWVLFNLADDATSVPLACVVATGPAAARSRPYG